MHKKASIALELKDGTIKSIHCHTKGAPPEAGQVLARHITSISKVQSLLALGDLMAVEVDLVSSLSEREPSLLGTQVCNEIRGQQESFVRTHTSRAQWLKYSEGKVLYAYLHNRRGWEIFELF